MPIMASPGKRGAPGKRRPGASEASHGNVAADPVAADLDAAMIAVGGVVGVECGVGLAVEEQPHVFGKGWPVVLEREQIVGALGADCLRDVLLAADGVDGHRKPRATDSETCC